MFNPVDWSTTKAMMTYRQEQLDRDIAKSITQTERCRRDSREDGLAWLRRTIGIMLIRMGARLAGTSVKPRLDPQL